MKNWLVVKLRVSLPEMNGSQYNVLRSHRNITVCVCMRVQVRGVPLAQLVTP